MALSNNGVKRLVEAGYRSKDLWLCMMVRLNSEIFADCAIVNN
jgi:hypothetical protein